MGWRVPGEAGSAQSRDPRARRDRGRNLGGRTGGRRYLRASRRRRHTRSCRRDRRSWAPGWWACRGPRARPRPPQPSALPAPARTRRLAPSSPRAALAGQGRERTVGRARAERRGQGQKRAAEAGPPARRGGETLFLIQWKAEQRRRSCFSESGPRPPSAPGKPCRRGAGAGERTSGVAWWSSRRPPRGTTLCTYSGALWLSLSLTFSPSLSLPFPSLSLLPTLSLPFSLFPPYSSPSLSLSLLPSPSLPLYPSLSLPPSCSPPPLSFSFPLPFSLPLFLPFSLPPCLFLPLPFSTSLSLPPCLFLSPSPLSLPSSPPQKSEEESLQVGVFGGKGKFQGWSFKRGRTTNGLCETVERDRIQTNS